MTMQTIGKDSAPDFDPTRLRRTILRMAFAGASVHLGCAFSLVEILAVLYRSHLNLGEGATPGAEGRDYLVLSKGHGVMAQYACFYEMGWLADADLDGYFRDGSRLKGLSDAHVPGCEVSSGSLGHGLSVGIGLALAAKRRGSPQRCYAIVGDGEMNEGSIWEGLLFAAHFRLDNLIVIVDANGFQAMGATASVMDLGLLQSKLEAFGYDCRTLDGHCERALDEALNELKSLPNGRPKCIVARTVKGQGVSFMEHNNIWHYTRLTDGAYADALSELGQP
jgi:transketolase